MDELEIAVGDYGMNWAFTVTDSDGTAYNLSGYTVKIKIWSPTIPATLLADLACTVDVAASGTCHWTVTNIFTRRDTYYGELQLTKSGVVESTETFLINVKESPL